MYSLLGMFRGTAACSFGACSSSRSLWNPILSADLSKMAIFPSVSDLLSYEESVHTSHVDINRPQGMVRSEVHTTVGSLHQSGHANHSNFQLHIMVICKNNIILLI
jgi:hypothetical protein